jgi:hypothetical protein
MNLAESHSEERAPKSHALTIPPIAAPLTTAKCQAQTRRMRSERLHLNLMPRSAAEILAPAQTELGRGRPRVALKELEAARAELVAARDIAGLGEALELALKVPTLAPVDIRSRERLLAAIARDISSIAPGRITQPAASATASAPALYVSFASTLRDQALTPARAAIERGETRRALRSLEKARRKLLDRSDVAGLGELLELAQRLPTTKAGHEKARTELIDAAQQNVRYLSHRDAIKTGEEWSDPFATGQPKAASKLRSLPPMSRREILIAAGIVVLLAVGATAWTLASRAPQRVVHAIKCPTGEEGSPTWSPDGKQIAFAKNGSCGTQIQIISARGGPTREVTKKYGVLPDWSANGRTILFRSSDGFSLVAAKGGKVHLIRKDDGDMGASWSPNGRRIAFVHGVAPDPYGEGFFSTLYTMRPDGSGVRRLLGHVCNPRTPDWSPSGRFLVFACDKGIYYMPSKGGSLDRLVIASFSGAEISVSAAPDARLVAFAAGDIETCTVNGNDDPKTIPGTTYGDTTTVDVAWAPDSKHIAFSVVGSAADDGLYVIDRDGKHRRRLVRF